MELPTERRGKDVGMTMFLRDGGGPVALCCVPAVGAHTCLQEACPRCDDVSVMRGPVPEFHPDR